MKPASMKKFDLFYLGSIVVGLVGIYFNWDTMMATFDAEMAARGAEAAEMAELGNTAIIGGLAFGIGINLLLWALVSIFRIEFAKWIVALFTAYGVVTLLLGFASAGFDTFQIIGIVTTAMTVLAVYFLFQPDSKAWLSARKSAD